MRVQGWDPVLIICQIISLQTIHYLSLSVIIPPVVTTLSRAAPLEYSGGAATIGHVLDWREMASRPTIHGRTRAKASADSKPEYGAWSGGKKIGTVTEVSASIRNREEAWDFGVDDRRGWMLGLSWLVACGIDIVPLYLVVRRPTHILDFSLTLVFIHLVLTTYTTKAFPTSMYFWVVQALGALLMVTVAEQLCVKREMATDLLSYDSGQAEEAIPLHERSTR